MNIFSFSTTAFSQIKVDLKSTEHHTGLTKPAYVHYANVRPNFLRLKAWGFHYPRSGH